MRVVLPAGTILIRCQHVDAAVASRRVVIHGTAMGKPAAALLCDACREVSLTPGDTAVDWLGMTLRADHAIVDAEGEVWGVEWGGRRLDN